MEVQVEGSRALRFADGRPVRAASALAPLAGGWLVAQDDATHGAWLVGDEVRELRLLPPVDGHDVFGDADGTRHLSPDLEAACGLPLEDGDAVLLLGSGGTPAQRRMVLVSDGGRHVESRDVSGFYAMVALALDLPEGGLDLQGVARNGPVLRVYQRADSRTGIANGSVDVSLPALVAAVRGRGDAGQVPLRRVLRYGLGTVDGLELAATDAVALPEGRVLLSAAAQDTAVPHRSGPVVGSALVLLQDDSFLDGAPLPRVAGAVQKVEGLAVREVLPDGLRLLAVVDADDPAAASLALDLRVTW